MSYFVYMLECSDATLYVGSTTDVLKRLHAHNHLKSGAHYTKIRRPVALRYSEELPTYAAVRAREGELKRLTRNEKLALIKQARPRATAKAKATRGRNTSDGQAK